ncbi:uncharacterized protein BBA_04699 [Beauveria bassiana ARSEF 2860]|uniref:Uncharacterized protein n=1 Tax=Beauveria bassiana (strain ARSEF 2860) TaxID=655819 RepID=J5JUM8_BEAB2|nr:uncharacterized protein BBA_04699 [Beauveria bassiana ARSEF 2860]EJP66206.1 hypothetical protein BBA_04699 [Beauveria bassiana ARSEF 2860]
MKYLVIAAAACASLMVTANAAPTASVVAACRSTIDDVFYEHDAEDDSAIKEKPLLRRSLPAWSIKGLHKDCDADNTLKLACQEIVSTITAVTDCKNAINDFFFDNDSDVKSDVDGKRNFCADIIGGITFDVSVKNAQLVPWSVEGLYEKCDTGDTVKSACQDIASAAAVACK